MRACASRNTSIEEVFENCYNYNMLRDKIYYFFKRNQLKYISIQKNKFVRDSFFPSVERSL